MSHWLLWQIQLLNRFNCICLNNHLNSKICHTLKITDDMYCQTPLPFVVLSSMVQLSHGQFSLKIDTHHHIATFKCDVWGIFYWFQIPISVSSFLLLCYMQYYVISDHASIIPINSLAPGGFENIFQNVFFKLISWIDTLSNSCETALRSMPQNPSDDKSTLVQVMAWCHQAASHYLSQCCPKSLSPYGVTRPQWVKRYWCHYTW